MLGDGTEIGEGKAREGGGEGKEAEEAGGDGRPEAAAEVSRKPQFFVKAGLDFAGAAWLRDGKYGRFISVVIDKDLSRGAKLRISPRREHAGILGAPPGAMPGQALNG